MGISSHMIRAWLLAATLILTTSAAASAGDRLETIPAKTPLHFHLAESLSSDRSITGQRFSFVMLDPIVVRGKTLVAKGTVGAGTVLLAGHSGTSGHEGDLTLRLNSIPTVDGRQLIFDDQRMRINGRNRKVMAGVLGFIPYAGLGARFIRGAEIRITRDTPVTTVLERNAATIDP